jgi:hypothetical protein
MTSTGKFGGNKEVAESSELHTKIVDRLCKRIHAAERERANQINRWKRDEEQFTAYVNYQAEDLQRKAASDRGIPEYVTLHIPYNYALLLALHTYITSTVFSKDPTWQFRGRHGETEKNIQAVESLISYQVLVGQHLPQYFVWTHDPLRYGYGILGHYWCEEMVQLIQRKKVKPTLLGWEIPGARERTEDVIEEVPGYYGTQTYNVRPADFLSDPRYRVQDFQKGEFCGREFQISYLDMKAYPDRYFNLEKLKELSPKHLPRDATSILDIPNTTRGDVPLDDWESRIFNAHELYVNIIPSEWGIKGYPDRPAKWVFLMLEEQLIVGMQPLGLLHNRYPFDITPGEVEGYDRVPRSLLYTTEALNRTLTWLVNSHFYNVRKSLNDQWIVDPSRVVVSDLLGKGPGKIVRLKPNAYGTDIRQIITQLPVTDVTASHLRDSEAVIQMLQRVSGINDNMMGAMQGNRATATEIRSSTTFGISRAKTLVEYMGACGFAPFVQKLVQTTQQLMDRSMKVRLVGDMATTGSYVDVTPETIAGFYDLEPVDGTLPIDRLAMVNLWTQMFQVAQGNPAIAQQLDMPGIFLHVGQLAGLREIKQFRINVLPPGMAPPPGSVPMAMPGLDNSGAPVTPQAGPGMGNMG